MGIGGQPLALHLLTEAFQLRFGQPAFKKSPGLDPGRRMPLKEYKIRTVLCLRSSPEMIEAHVVKCRGRGEACNVTAEFTAGLVGPHHHGECIPAD